MTRGDELTLSSNILITNNTTNFITDSFNTTNFITLLDDILNKWDT